MPRRVLHGLLQRAQVACTVDHHAVLVAVGDALDVAEDAQVAVKPGRAVPVHAGIIVRLCLLLKSLPEIAFQPLANSFGLVHFLYFLVKGLWLVACFCPASWRAFTVACMYSRNFSL